MMKKVIFLLALIFFTFIFISPRNASASCLRKLSIPLINILPEGCSQNNWPCTDELGQSFCCTVSSTECRVANILNLTPTPVPLPSFLGGTGGTQCVQTALGCIPTNTAQFTTWLLRFAIGIGGGIAFLLMLWGGLQIVLSAGNPEKIKAGREIITSALAGLILIIFSVFLLRLIGYDILRLPGFQP